MINQRLSTAVQSCLDALGIEQAVPPRTPKIDVLADPGAVLEEINILRDRALELIEQAETTVADIVERTGLDVTVEEFVGVVRSAVAERLFLTGLPHRGPVLTMESLEEQVTLDPNRDYDRILDALIDEAIQNTGASLEEVDIQILTDALNSPLFPEDPSDLGFDPIVIIASMNERPPRSANRIFKMINALGMRRRVPVTIDVATRLRRILVLNKKLGERMPKEE
ncbi:MAG: hypothetical protein WC924_02045 [Candidatus Gracilibacteria bacterium]